MNALALTLLAACAAAAPENAEVYWSADRLAAVTSHRIDFYLLPEGVGAYFYEDGRLRPVAETFPARGELRFYEASTVKAIGSHALFKLYEPGTATRLDPAKRMTFGHPLTHPPRLAAKRDSFLVCTDPWLGRRRAPADHDHFCGALSLAGEVLFNAPQSQDAHETLEPLGLSPRADEAFFAVVEVAETRQPKRVVKEYLLWTRNGGFKRLVSQPPTPELQERLYRYMPEYYLEEPRAPNRPNEGR